MTSNGNDPGYYDKQIELRWDRTREGRQGALVGRAMVTGDGQPVEPMPAYAFHCVRKVDVAVAPTFLGAVAELHHQTGFSYDLCLSALLAAASSAVQTCADCEAQYVPLAPTALYIAISGGSGVGKSAVGKRAFRAITEFNADLIASALSAKLKAEDDLNEWEFERKLIERQAQRASARTGDTKAAMAIISAHLAKKPKAHTIPQLVINAGTPEGLVAAIAENPYGVVIPSYEGGLFLEGRLSSSIPLLNGIWSGEPYDNHLASGKRVYLPSPRAVTFVCAQGTVWKKFFSSKRKNARDTGYIARNLFVRVGYPISPGSAIQTNDVSGAMERFDARIKQILSDGIGRHDAGDQRVVITLSDSALPRWEEIRAEIKSERRKGGLYEDAEDHAAKLPENILRVAAVIHVLEGFSGGISDQVLELAYLICLQYSMEYLHAFCQQADVDVLANLLMDTLERYAGNSKRMISKSYMANRVPQVVQGKRNYDRAISYLVEKKVIGVVMHEEALYLDMKPGADIPDGSIFWSEFAIRNDKK